MDNKTEQVMVRFTPDELEEIVNLAEEMGFIAKSSKRIMPASYLADRGLHGDNVLIKLQGIGDVIEGLIMMRTLSSELRKIKNRLNEIAEGDFEGDINDTMRSIFLATQTDMMDVLEYEKKMKESLMKLIEDWQEVKKKYGLLYREPFG